jgi:glycerol-3-phosphate dehydrogenase (NAD(P)+)
LAELTRLVLALGGCRETLYGLAGLGDLMLTATGALSRNRAVGIELGKGRAVDEIIRSMRMVAEGVGSASSTMELARRHGVEMPIAEHVLAILEGRCEPAAAIRDLMRRPLKSE